MYVSRCVYTDSALQREVRMCPLNIGHKSAPVCPSCSHQSAGLKAALEKYQRAVLPAPLRSFNILRLAFCAFLKTCFQLLLWSAHLFMPTGESLIKAGQSLECLDLLVLCFARPKPIAKRENVTVDILFYEVENAREDM